MYELGEDIFYYITLGNEPYAMPAMPKGAAEGILRGLYKLRPASGTAKTPKVHLFGSGTLLREAVRAQEILDNRYGVKAEVWSATSYKELRRDALETERWNMLHPAEQPKRSYIERILENEKGVFIAVSDYMKAVPEMVGRWVPGGLFPLGTDGFGRSDSRVALRRFFEVDAECVTIAALWRLAQRGAIKVSVVEQAIRDLDVNPEKLTPLRA
jgi:pyruvate dehydrogenase E1 component